MKDYREEKQALELEIKSAIEDRLSECDKKFIAREDADDIADRLDISIQQDFDIIDRISDLVQAIARDEVNEYKDELRYGNSYEVAYIAEKTHAASKINKKRN